MTPSFFTLVWVCFLLCALQALAALPWLFAMEYRLRALLRKPSTWGKILAACAGLGLLLGFYFDANSDPGVLARIGRVYAGFLHLQLAADFFVAVFAVALLVWPKGAAVALSAFREG